MHTNWAVLKMGLRASIWKATPNPPMVGLATLLGCAAAALVVELLLQWAEAGGTELWSPYGFNSLATTVALMAIVTALFFRPEVRATAVSASFVFWVVSGVAEVAFELVAPAVDAEQSPAPGLWTPADFRLLFALFVLVWWVGATLAIFRSVDPRKYLRHLVPLGGLFAASVALMAALPHDRVFRAHNFDYRTANTWELIRTNWSGYGDNKALQSRTVASASAAAQVERSQPMLLEEMAAQLSPQRPGVTDVYAIGVAGWANQEVFRKELNGAFDAFARAFGTQGRTIKLVNDPDTVAVSPIATRQNLAAAVRTVARVMNKQEDVLLLFLTSHGDKQGVALQFDRLVYSAISPDDVAAVLADEGILNRIVIVSACYSGVFIKPLADFNTIVLTAADENSTSFGCSNEREWTYFGDALFNQSLLPGRDLEHAFNAAKGLVEEWEARDGITSSNPQAHFGVMLKEKLTAIYDFARSAERQSPGQEPIVGAVPQ